MRRLRLGRRTHAERLARARRTRAHGAREGAEAKRAAEARAPAENREEAGRAAFWRRTQEREVDPLQSRRPCNLTVGERIRVYKGLRAHQAAQSADPPVRGARTDGGGMLGSEWAGALGVAAAATMAFVGARYGLGMDLGVKRISAAAAKLPTAEEAAEMAQEAIITRLTGGNEDVAVLLNKLPTAIDTATSAVANAKHPPTTLREIQALAKIYSYAETRPPYEEAGRAFAGVPCTAEDCSFAGAVEALAMADAAYETDPEVTRRTCAERGFPIFIPLNLSATPGDPACFIAVDPRRKTAFLSVRGTHTMADVITDLVSSPESDEGVSTVIGGTMSSQGSGGAAKIHAHGGMLASARAVLSRARAIVKHLLAPDGYALIITGHSLGAGTAALLTLMLHSELGTRADDDESLKALTEFFFPSSSTDADGSKDKQRQTPIPRIPIACYAFACPPILDAASALACSSHASGASYARFFEAAASPLDKVLRDAPWDDDDHMPLVTTFVARDDIIPRASLRNLVRCGEIINAVDEAMHCDSEVAPPRAAAKESIAHDPALAPLAADKGGDTDTRVRDAIKRSLSEELSPHGILSDAGLGYADDLVLPGLVLYMESAPGAAADEAAEADEGNKEEVWRARSCDGLSPPMRILEIAPRSISDHGTAVYTAALASLVAISGKAPSIDEGDKQPEMKVASK